MMLLASASAFAEDAVPKIDSGDTAWMIVATAMVMLMTPGLAFFYAGMVRTKNVVSTLLQNFAAFPVIGLVWLVCGYTLAFGSSQGGLIGGLNFFMLDGVGQAPNADYSGTIPHNLFMLFQCMFAVITPVLMTGAIAERVRFKPLLFFIAAWSILIYSPVAHWVWGVGGWIREKGGLDFAGGMVVHMTAGYSALMFVYLLGKRKDFGKETKPYDAGMVLLGTALLWFGWFGFNAGSALGANGIATHAFATTFFAACAAFLSWMSVDMFRKSKASAIGAGVGAVAGLVAITPAAGFVSYQAAVMIGLLSGVVCNYAVVFIKEKLHFDDTLDVIGCHGVGGTLGTILTAVFASKAINPAGADGLLSGNTHLFFAHLMGSAAVLAVSLVGTFVIFKVVDSITPLRASANEEQVGLDISQHGEVINTGHEAPAAAPTAGKLAA